MQIKNKKMEAKISAGELQKPTLKISRTSHTYDLIYFSTIKNSSFLKQAANRRSIVLKRPTASFLSPQIHNKVEYKTMKQQGEMKNNTYHENWLLLKRKPTDRTLPKLRLASDKPSAKTINPKSLLQIPSYSALHLKCTDYCNEEAKRKEVELPKIYVATYNIAVELRAKHKKRSKL